MVHRLRSKRFNGFVGCVWLMLGTLLLVWPNILIAEPLPELHYVGVVPVQWGDDATASYILGSVKDKIDAQFIDVASRPNKFFMLNQDLVASLWSTPPGRRELVEQHELHGFVALYVNLQTDVAVLHARLLSPTLDSYLLESETVAITELRRSVEEELDALLSNLVFRLYNRIPVDVRTTSIQGRFVTLSGGQRQNVREGERLEVVRPSIATRHPANATWMRIDTRPVGVVRVVEVKQHTAVAVIESQVDDHAIRVGDGARIADIGSRARFRVAESSEIARERGPVVISPLYPSGKSIEKVETPSRVTKIKNPHPVQVREPEPRRQPSQEKHLTAEDVFEQDERDESSQEEHERGDTLYDILALLVDEGTVHAGVNLWSYRQSASAKAQFPMIMINHVGIGALRQLGEQLHGQGQLQLHFGSTSKGSFFGFEAQARGYLRRPVGDGMHWRAGGFGGLHSLAIEDESYGGGDIVFVGGFAGVEGLYTLLDTDLAFYTELGIRPMNFGQMGIKGSKSTIENAFGHHIRAQVSLPSDEQGSFEWGLRLESASTRFSLDDNQKIQFNTIQLQVLAGYQF